MVFRGSQHKEAVKWIPDDLQNNFGAEHPFISSLLSSVTVSPSVALGHIHLDTVHFVTVSRSYRWLQAPNSVALNDSISTKMFYKVSFSSVHQLCCVTPSSGAQERAQHDSNDDWICRIDDAAAAYSLKASKCVTVGPSTESQVLSGCLSSFS
jgi:hypothetical protein